MNEILIILLLLPIAYLLGSIPSSVLAGKIFHGADIRELGSKNPGATNTYRVFGAKTAIPVLLFDMFKGWGASMLIVWFTDTSAITYESLIRYQLLLGVIAALGHLFPVFAKFKGGKGVATLFGMALAIHPVSALIIFAVFIITVVISKFVSLGSLSGAIIWPFLLIFIFKFNEPVFLAFTILIALIVIITHRSNIQRLLKGDENKIKI